MAATNENSAGLDMNPFATLVDLNSNTATFEGVTVVLSPMLAEYVSVLAAQYPKNVSTAAASIAMYGCTDIVQAQDEAVNCFAYRAHKRLAALGIGIAAFKLRGRRLYLLADGVPAGASQRGRVPDHAMRNSNIVARRARGFGELEIAMREQVSVDVVKGVIRRAGVR